MTTQLALSVIDSTGAQQFLNFEQAVSVLTGDPLTAVNSLGVTVPVFQSTATVLGTLDTAPITQALTFTVVALAAGAVTPLIVANPVRKSLQILNISTQFVTASTSSAVAVGSGYPLEVAAAAGHQGGSTPIYDGAAVTTDAWFGIAAAAATVLVIEGN
jgi:hypothetical protein